MKLAFIFMIAAEATRVIEPIFWKVDNQKFRDGGFTRHVQLQTKMDIFCPQYESPADEDPRTFSQSHHFQTIYMVDEESFNTCQLDAARAKKDNVLRAALESEKVHDEISRSESESVRPRISGGHQLLLYLNVVGQ